MILKACFKPITDYAYTKRALEALSSATLCARAVCGVDSDWLNAVIIGRKYIIALKVIPAISFLSSLLSL